MQGGWAGTPPDHPGLFLATAETARPGQLMAALRQALQVGGASPGLLTAISWVAECDFLGCRAIAPGLRLGSRAIVLTAISWAREMLWAAESIPNCSWGSLWECVWPVWQSAM